MKYNKRLSRKCKHTFEERVKKEKILNIVCDHFHISFDELNTNSRKRDIVYPRQVIMYFLWEFTLPTFKTVGEVFHRDHTTVMYSISTINNIMETNKDVFNEIEYLQQKVLAEQKS